MLIILSGVLGAAAHEIPGNFVEVEQVQPSLHRASWNFVVHYYFGVVSQALQFFLDADECSANASLCDVTCVNTVGSYRCECGTGYQLSNDGSSCTGKP